MKKIFGIMSLIACLALILCGCGTWKKVNSLKLQSIQSGSEITFKVSGISGDMYLYGSDGVTHCYSDEKSAEEMLTELKEKNDYEFVTENGFDFIRVPNQGIYYLNIYTEERKTDDGVINRTSVYIRDMSCSFNTHNTQLIERFPFPYFALQNYSDKVSDDDIGLIPDLKLNNSYDCNAEELLNLVKKLGVWEVEEKENSFIMSFKEDKLEVVYGEGTVTLQSVAVSEGEVA